MADGKWGEVQQEEAGRSNLSQNLRKAQSMWRRHSGTVLLIVTLHIHLYEAIPCF